MHEYTPEEIEDIKGRQIKAIEILKELELFPAAELSAHNNGEDVFGFKVTIVLKNSKIFKKEETAPVVIDAEVVPSAPTSETVVETATVDPINPQPEA